MQEVHPRHPLQRAGRSATVPADLGIHRLRRFGQRGPRDNPVHIRQELRAARGFAGVLETAECMRLHRGARVDVTSGSDSGGAVIQTFL